MNNYLKSAMSILYGETDDFLLLGLTGRTGSGCTTVANILQSEKELINHTLFSGDNPSSNDERKQKIIGKYHENTWREFSLIQASAVLVLMFAECDRISSIEYVKSKLPNINEVEIENLKSNLDEISLRRKSILTGGKGASNFYAKELPFSCAKIKAVLGSSKFIILCQKIGTNVRISGNPINEELLHGKFFSLASRINEIVKEIRQENKSEKRKTFIAIDAIRSPLEAIFFQERYAAFFLVAVSCPDKDRKGRLRNLGISEADISKIDDQEYVSRDISKNTTYSVQDIQACLQRADLHISNPNEINIVSEFKTLANQILRFVTLMKRPGSVTPTAIERGMQIAHTAKLFSGCISRQVGAVITDKDFSIQAVGWNDTPHGQVPCNLRNRFDLLAGKDQAAYSLFEKNDSKFIDFFTENTKKYVKISETGRNVSYCFKSEFNTLKKKDNQVHTRSLHAEENAFLQISKYGGRGIEGGCLFTTASPCELCAKKAYQLGIKKIYYIDPYPGIATDHIIMAGSKSPELILFSGAIGPAYHRLYTPVVAYKDELNALKENDEVNVGDVSNAKNVFFKIREEINNINNMHDKIIIEKAISDLESTYGTTSFLEKYIDFIDASKDCIVSFSIILPRLTKLLN